MPKIIVEDVYKIFGPHPKKAVKFVKEGMSKEDLLKRKKHSVGVGGVSFHVEEGEILVIMGLSGSGKSTLVRCLNRLIEPTAGTIMVDGTDIGSLDDKGLRRVRQEKFGMVFQHFGLFPHRTVAENTEYGLEIKGVDPAARRKKAVKVLEQVGLQGHEDSYPAQLSGGMQQRVGLARALALNPWKNCADRNPGRYSHESCHPVCGKICGGCESCKSFDGRACDEQGQGHRAFEK